MTDDFDSAELSPREAVEQLMRIREDRGQEAAWEYIKGFRDPDRRSKLINELAKAEGFGSMLETLQDLVAFHGSDAATDFLAYVEPESVRDVLGEALRIHSMRMEKVRQRYRDEMQSSVQSGVLDSDGNEVMDGFRRTDDDGFEVPEAEVKKIPIWRRLLGEDGKPRPVMRLPVQGFLLSGMIEHMGTMKPGTNPRAVRDLGIIEMTAVGDPIPAGLEILQQAIDNGYRVVAFDDNLVVPEVREVIFQKLFDAGAPIFDVEFSTYGGAPYGVDQVTFKAGIRMGVQSFVRSRIRDLRRRLAFRLYPNGVFVRRDR